MAKTLKLLGALDRVDDNVRVQHVDLTSTRTVNEVDNGAFTLPIGGAGNSKTAVALPAIASPTMAHFHCAETFLLEYPTGTAFGHFQGHVVLQFPTNRGATSFSVSMVASVTSSPFSYTLGATV